MHNNELLDELLERVNRMEDGEAVDEVRIADSREGLFYRHDDQTRLALKVALITARPLLLVGPPGCGKSSLAPYVARNLRLKQLSYTVTETAESSDLLWRIDYLKRLHDAQVKAEIRPMSHYVDKGVLWRAFESTRAADSTDSPVGTLVLIDEIDKASSGFANSLLVALGSLEFEVPPLDNAIVKADKNAFVLVIMTSNDERELPPALTRRCVVLRVKYPTAPELVDITFRRWPMRMKDEQFRASVTSLAEGLTADAGRMQRVSTAEFLDLVQVLIAGDIHPKDPRWATVEQLVLVTDEN